MKHIQFKVIVAVLLGTLAFAGCKKILDLQSTHTVTESNFWNSHEDTRAALIGVYGLMRAALADNNAHWMYGELRGGDFLSLQRQDLKAVIEGNLRASYPLMNNLSDWRRFYAVINAANLFIERAPDVKAKDTLYTLQTMRVDIAQMKVLRSFAYFYMSRIWGDVPLLTASHDGDFIDMPRAPQDSVLAFAKGDLLEAAADLPHSYSNDDPKQQGNYYNEDAGRWGGALVRELDAYALLAHIAAWQGAYDEVSKYTQMVMDNYGLEGHGFATTDNLTNSDGFFSGRQTNQMIAFNFLWAHTDASFSGHLEELTLAKPLVDKEKPDVYVPKDSILAVFNLKGDERFSIDTLTGLPSSERYFTGFDSRIPVFSKIKVVQGGGVSDPTFRIYGSAIVFERLEEMALLRAEALAVLGDNNGAMNLLNQIRDLRKAARYDPTTGEDLTDAIFQERRRELMGESWRWYDEIRYHKIKQDDPAFLQLIDQGGIYWPVSKEVIQKNKLITQNPYWK